MYKHAYVRVCSIRRLGLRVYRRAEHAAPRDANRCVTTTLPDY